MARIAREGGDESFERAKWHFRVIEKYANLGVCIVVPHANVKAVCSEYRLAPQWANPYYPAMAAFVSIIGYLFRAQDAEVDFIFDGQTESRVIMETWNRNILWNRVRTRKFPRLPRFEREEQFLPLQAADMLAWHAREKFIQTGTVAHPDGVFCWPQSEQRPSYAYGLLEESGMRAQIYNTIRNVNNPPPSPLPLHVYPSPSFLRSARDIIPFRLQKDYGAEYRFLSAWSQPLSACWVAPFPPVDETQFRTADRFRQRQSPERSR